MNSYNIFDPRNYSTIIYCAIARDEDQVKELALSAGFKIDKMVIELERTDIRDEMGRPLPASIQYVVVQ